MLGDKKTYPTNVYLRDVSGNVMAIYEATEYTETPSEPTILLKEIPIYGSTRLGQYRPFKDELGQVNKDLKTALGQRIYEFSNHLGNVLVTLTDNKVPNQDGTYKAIVLSASDYYPFGMAMKERTFANSEYRFGFNGKENDTDFGSHIQDLGARFYSGALGRMFSIDPIGTKMPDLSVYQFANNNPIRLIDFDGLIGLDPQLIISTARVSVSFALVLAKTRQFMRLQRYIDAGGSGHGTSGSTPYLVGAAGEAIAAESLFGMYNVHAIKKIDGKFIPFPNPAPFPAIEGDFTYEFQPGGLTGKIDIILRPTPGRVSSVNFVTHGFSGNVILPPRRLTGTRKTLNVQVKADGKTASAVENLIGGMEEIVKASETSGSTPVLVADLETWRAIVNQEVYKEEAYDKKTRYSKNDRDKLAKAYIEFRKAGGLLHLIQDLNIRSRGTLEMVIQDYQLEKLKEQEQNQQNNNANTSNNGG